MGLFDRLRGRSQSQEAVVPTTFEKVVAAQRQQEQQLAAGGVSEIDPRADQLNHQALRFYEANQQQEA
jgi:hypothetical protein